MTQDANGYVERLTEERVAAAVRTYGSNSWYTTRNLLLISPAARPAMIQVPPTNMSFRFMVGDSLEIVGLFFPGRGWEKFLRRAAVAAAAVVVAFPVPPPPIC